MIVSQLQSLFSLKIDKSSFKAGENAVAELAESAQGWFHKVAGAFAAYEVFEFVDGLVRVGSELDDVSKRIGITSTALQQLRFAAGQDGVSAGELEGALRRLSASAFQASEGGAEAADVYRKLGVNVKNADGSIKDSEQLISEVADGFTKIKNTTERSALAMKIFGRSGSVLIPFLSRGATGLEEMRQRFNDLGGGFSPLFVHNADEVGDKLEEVHIITNSLKSRIGNVLLPIISSAVTKFTDFGIAILKVLKGTDYLRFALVGLAAASVAAGIRAILPWLPMIGMWALIAVGAAVFLAVLEDVYQFLEGNKSLIGEWIDEWAGLGAVNDWVKDWHTGLAAIPGILREIYDGTVDLFHLLAKTPSILLTKLFGGALNQDELDLIDRTKKRDRTLADSLDAATGPNLRDSFGAPQYANSREEFMKSKGYKDRLGGAGPLSPSLVTAMAGSQSALAQGPLFGQATQEAVAGQGNSSPVINQSVTVNAKTGASAEDIATHVNKALDNQNRNLRHALSGRASR